MIRRLVVALVVCLMLVPSVALAILQYPNPVLYSQVEGDPDEPSNFTDRGSRLEEWDLGTVQRALVPTDFLLMLKIVVQCGGTVILP